MIIEKKSPVTGKTNTMDLDVTPEQLQQWRAGALIQNVMPHLTPTEREFLISGYTEDDWNTLYGNDINDGR